MSLALGIFLAALILAAVILFSATKDRWNWRKILLWGFTSIIATIAVIALVFWRQSLPRAENELFGVSLGDSVSDVKFRKGKPSSEVFGYIWTYPYSVGGAYCFVEFYQNAVDQIFLFPVSRDLPFSFQGISFGSSLKDIGRVFGTPSRVDESDDDMYRLVSFSDYNIAFMLRQNSTVGVAIFNGRRSAGLTINDKIIQAEPERRRMDVEKNKAEEVARDLERKRQQEIRDAIVAKANAETAEADRLEKERRAQADNLERERRAKVEEERQVAIAQQRLRQQREQAAQEQLRRNQLSKWSRLQVGMTTVQVEQLLGRPNSISTFVDWSTWWFPTIPGEFSVLKVTFKYGRVESFEGPDLSR
jgi:hypothetical protein